VSHIATVSQPIVSRPQTTHGATTPAANSSHSSHAPAPQPTPEPTPTPAPAAGHAPAPQAMASNAMSVLIDVQAGLEKLGGAAAQAVGEVIERLEDRFHPQPPPQPQPQPAPTPKPVVIPGGDTGAATLSSAAVAARLLQEGGMLQASAQRSASWAQQRADRQVADANAGITLLKATLSGYEAWQGRLAQSDNGQQLSLAA